MLSGVWSLGGRMKTGSINRFPVYRLYQYFLKYKVVLTGSQCTGCTSTEEFRKRVKEMSSQLFVTQYSIYAIYPSAHKQLRQHLPNPFREFPCTSQNKQYWSYLCKTMLLI